MLCKSSLDELIQAVEQNDKERIPALVDQLYEDINRNSLDAKLVSLNIDYLLFQLVHMAQAQDTNVNQEEILEFINGNAFDSGTMRGSRMHLKRFAEEYADYLSQLRGKNIRGSVMGDVEQYIKEHYAENLTLKDLGQKYFINSAYLGQLFRKTCGVSFKDYLNNYRIDMAASLLLHTDLKNYEIMEKVGYHDLDYFINKFIALKGCTPSRFRRKSRSKSPVEASEYPAVKAVTGLFFKKSGQITVLLCNYNLPGFFMHFIRLFFCSFGIELIYKQLPGYTY